MQRTEINDNDNKATTRRETTAANNVHIAPAAISKHLSALQWRGFKKAGAIVCSGDYAGMPSLESANLLGHIDRMLDYMTKEDLDGLKSLLAMFGVLPSFVVEKIIAVGKYEKKLPGPFGTAARMINLGVRGLFFTLYYSNLDEKGEIYKQLGWQTQVVQRPEDMQDDFLPGQRPMMPIVLTQPDPEQCREIFQRARLLQPQLRALTVAQRLHYLEALKEVILNNREMILTRIQADTKKSRSDALISEFFGTVDHLAFLIGNAVKVLKDEKVKTPIALMGKTSVIHYAPMGTVLVVSPWNYPFYQAIVPITCSFIAGNATIFKPSEYTPLTGLVEELLGAAGFHRDWVQVVYGEGSVGRELIAQRPNKIFFTGSVATGKKIMQQASSMLIPVELELGGKDPMIVFDDVNLDRASAAAVWGAFTNTGQSCTSVERLYVQQNIFSQFRDLVVQKTKMMTQAIDSDGNGDIGHMTTPMQRDIVRAHLEDALKKGAVQLTGENWDRQSMAIPAIVLDNVNHEMLVMREETFGPLLPICAFQDEAEVIALANDSAYGLSASVWSKNKLRAVRVARAIDTGNVSINNVMVSEGNHYLPFGGVKDSGIGRYKGAHGLRMFCNMKSVLIDSDSSKIEANWYPYTSEKFQLFAAMTDGLFRGTLKGFVAFAVNGMKLESYSAKAAKNLLDGKK